MFIEAGVSDDVIARGEHFFEEVFGNLPVAAVAGDLIHTGRADDLGDVRVRVQALQLVAALGQRVEEAGLLEEVSGVEIAVFFGDGRKIDEHLIHAAVLGAQHTLALIGADYADPPEIRSRPLRHAFADLKGICVAGQHIHIQQTGHDLVVRVERRPGGLAFG